MQEKGVVNIDIGSSPYTLDDAMRWALVVAIAAADLIWLYFSQISVVREGLYTRGLFALNLISVLVIMALIRLVRSRRGAAPIRFSRNVELAVHATLYWSLASGVLGLLQYLVITINPPLLDQTLAALDRRMGFNWLALNAWISAAPAVRDVLKFAYDSIAYQCLIISVYLCMKYDVQRLAAFNSEATLIIFLTLIISAPLAAHPASIYYGVADAVEIASQTDFDALRAGVRTINLNEMQGIVTMPSLHAALAFLFAYNLRGTLLFVPGVVLNVLMMISTLTAGGHYLIDTLGGIGVAILGIWMVAMLSRYRGPLRRSMPAPPITITGRPSSA